MGDGRLTVSGSGVVVAGDTGPFALAAKNGTALWHVTQDGETPLLGTDGVAYAGFAAKSDTTGGVTALAPATGTVLWTFAFGPVSDMTGTIAVAAGVVYATSSDGEIFALSAANGTKQQRITGSFGDFGGPPG
jgi:outer membrane protein assembly factor BamB